MRTKPVYALKNEKGWLFSQGVTRDFGENVVIHLPSVDGRRVTAFAAVMPLKTGVTDDLEFLGMMYVE